MKTVLLLTVAVAVAVVVGAVVDRNPQPETKGESAPALAPQAQEAPAEPSDGAIEGTVREAFDVAGYTYLRLEDAGVETWAAVSKATIAVGSRVTIVDAARMTDFHSASLKRTFPVIYFGNLAGGAGAGSAGELPPGHPDIGAADLATALNGASPHGASPHGASPHGASPHGAAATVDTANVSVPKASGPNARTIAELFADRAKLNGKQVRVQGRIVKATRVQGVTYYRLRDGSSTDPASAELVVSSSAERKVGDTVTFEGTPGVDVDIGIGVKYALMLQNARDLEP